MHIERWGLDGEPWPYAAALDAQRARHALVAAGESPATLLLVEHAGVYTAGRRTSKAERPTDGTVVVDVDRGGRITWHGPGQLVAYPVVRLREPVDVVRYVRHLEAAVTDVCAVWGLRTVTVAGRSGVWVPADDRGPARKVCAIGVRVARATTMHGLALTCSSDLAAFDRIVPCGIRDAGVTSLSAELGRLITPRDVADDLVAALRRHLDPIADLGEDADELVGAAATEGES